MLLFCISLFQQWFKISHTHVKGVEEKSIKPILSCHHVYYIVSEHIITQRSHLLILIFVEAKIKDRRLYLPTNIIYIMTLLK